MVQLSNNNNRPRSNGLKRSKYDALLGGVVLVVLLWVIGGFSAWKHLQQTYNHGQRTATNVSVLVARQATAAIQQIDLSLKRSAEEIGKVTLHKKASIQETFDIMRTGFLGIRDLRLIIVWDAYGETLFLHQLDYSDQNNIKIDQLILEKLKQESHTLEIQKVDESTIGFSRTFYDKEGQPAGQIAALVDVKYFDNVLSAEFSNMQLNAQLIDQNGRLAPKGGVQDSSIPVKAATMPLDGELHAEISYDRVNVVVPLTDYPLALATSFPLKHIKREWRDQTISAGAIASLFSVLILAYASHSRRTFNTFLEEVKTRAEAESSLKKLSRAVEQSPAMVMITDVDAIIEYINPKYCEITGYNQEEVLGRNPKFLSAHRTQTTDYTEMWQTLQKGQIWKGQFLNRKKNGTLYWESASISPIKDDFGKTTHYLAIKEDITNKKSIEDQLQLTSAVFEVASEAIMVCDSNLIIETVNNSFSEITGYSADEVIGKKPSILKSGRHGPDFYGQMLQRLHTHGKWEGEIWNRRKNGEIYPQWLSIKTIQDENGEIIRYISLFTDITHRKKNEEKILYQANYDTLTGLPNRSLFMDRLNRALLRAERSKASVALMFLDLDRFKHVNDTLGHASGDMLLKEAARRLTNLVRKTDTVARLGGDEFTVIIQDLEDYHFVENLVEKLLHDLSAPYDLDNNVAFVSASIGITIFPDDGANIEDLLKNADTAMYQAKENGRNLSQFYTSEMNTEAQERRDLENALHLALEREEFVLHYQPIVDAQTGNLVSCEVLLRWHHPEHGNVFPDKFIPLAEDTGLILPIGEWVLTKACHEAMNWAKYNKNPPNVSVNVSSRQFKRSDVPTLVTKALETSGLPARRLTLEITESLLIEDDENIIRQLKAVRELGIGLSIDDFGTGYSSLSYLRRFPISTLKIDRAFIKDLTIEAEADALVSAILSMAQSLNLKVVAEGVEEFKQLEVLQAGGCEYIQGYYYSPPVPVEAFRIFAKRTTPLSPDE